MKNKFRLDLVLYTMWQMSSSTFTQARQNAELASFDCSATDSRRS
jgi:hypothetical protein